MGTRDPAFLSYRTSNTLVAKMFVDHGLSTSLSISEEIRQFVHSPDSRYLAAACSPKVCIYSMQSFILVVEIPIPNIQEMAFSPASSFLCLWTRSRSGQTANNCWIIDVKSGKEIASFYSPDQAMWMIHWGECESIFFRLGAQKELEVYSTDQPHHPIHSHSFEGLQAFSVASRDHQTKVGVFIRGQNAKPSSIRLFDFPNFQTPVAMKSLFKVDQVEFHWSHFGMDLLALIQTHVDTSGKLYYGENSLVFLSGRGGLDCNVIMDKPGSVQDLCWSPIRKEFLVAFGYSPPSIGLFDKTCDKVFDFGTGCRNHVKFNPQGNLAFFAAIGNFSGNIEIWKTINGFEKVAEIADSEYTFCEWSPDGRYLLLATLAPRLQVDNGYKIYHYTGTLVTQEQFKDKLFQVEWVPSKSKHIDCFQIEKATTVTTKSAAYVPPSLRRSRKKPGTVGLTQ